MNKINLSGKILNMKGEEFPTAQSLAELLGNALMGAAVKPPVSTKYFSWALACGKDGIIEVDDIDKKTLIDFISESDGFNVLGRHRLLEAFDKK